MVPQPTHQGGAGAVRGLLLSLRPGQWVKNLACGAGLVFSGKLFHPDAALAAMLAVLGFCLGASAIYLINDLFDRPLDRRHPTKRSRPIASGEVSTRLAVAAAVALAAAAIASSLLLPRLCTILLVFYLALGWLYSWRFKHTVILDVLIIALGFVLRVLYGVYAVQVLPSSWIVLCMFALALFLGFAKRRGELQRTPTESDGRQHRRPVLRKYELAFLNQMLGVTATMAILCYSLYTVTARPGNPTLVLTVPIVVYGVFRVMFLVMIHGLGETPETELIGEPVSLAIVALWVLSCVVILYGDIHLFLELKP